MSKLLHDAVYVNVVTQVSNVFRSRCTPAICDCVIKDVAVCMAPTRNGVERHITGDIREMTYRKYKEDNAQDNDDNKPAGSRNGLYSGL